VIKDEIVPLFPNTPGTYHTSSYDGCSGQIINKEKSSTMFSKNTKENAKNQIMAYVGYYE